MPSPVRYSAILLPALFAATLLTGCSGFNTTTSPAALNGVALAGSVHGGQPPVTGAHVYLLAAGTNSYGGASSSLLTPGLPGVSTDSNGFGYVTTDNNGNFGLTGDYLCPAGNQAYLLAVGGNPGLAAGTSNNALTLVSALGGCGTFGPTSTLTINEVTTVAAVTALQQFMTDGFHIGAPSTDTTGLNNAFADVPNLVNLPTGTARSATTLGNGSVPQAKINTLANILAPCVNSASRTSTACANLFAAVTPSGSGAPLDVVAAMLLLAQNPHTSNVSTIYNQSNAAAPFQPMLATAPNDFSLAITYTGGTLTSPGYVVIDASGNAWTANCPSCAGVASTDSVVGFSPAGAVLSGATGYTAGIHKPQALAFDNAGNLWSTDLATGGNPDQIVKQTGATLAFAFNDSTISNPQAIAIDNANNAWVTNLNLSNAVKVTSGGTRTQAPVTSAGFSFPTGIAIDAYNTIYAAGAGSSSILKFNSGGTVLSPPAGYTGAGLNQPTALSIDAGNGIWTIDNGSSGVSVLHGYDGSVVSPAPGYFVGVSNANLVAIDGFGTAWIANCRASCGDGSGLQDDIIHVSANGAIIGAAGGLMDANLARVGVAAIDGSGNLWVSNNAVGSLTKFLGVAVPVKTPIATASSTNKLGQRP